MSKENLNFMLCILMNNKDLFDLIISQLRTKYSSSKCPNHARRTMSSIKKRSKVRRILRTMFGEANVRPIKNGLKQLTADEVSKHGAQRPQKP